MFQIAHAFCALERIVVEPGYYEEGSFGIRLETIVEVVVKDTPVRNLVSSHSGLREYTCL